jgi:DNA-binding GntR family transcriptional regulator
MGSSLTRVRAALLRLERFRVISVNDGTVFVRIALPPLTRRQLDQLPPYLLELYEARRAATR